MKSSVMIDTRLKSKIEYLIDYSDLEKQNNPCYSVEFKDLQDKFFFYDKNKLQEFLNIQTVERFYDKTLRKGYFDYINEYSEILRFFVKSYKGNLELLEEKYMQHST